MSRGSINFFNEDITYSLKQKIHLKNWIRDTIEAEGYKLLEINFIFCSDDYLLKINEEFLNHSTYTDIITFDNSEKTGHILADIFISIERILENAAQFNTVVTDELHRVLIHGTLHLLGYTDKPKTKKVLMTAMENKYLNLRAF
jgi:probable rRNA maturation factor